MTYAGAGPGSIRKRSTKKLWQSRRALSHLAELAMDAPEKRGARAYAKDVLLAAASAGAGGGCSNGDAGRPIASLKNNGNICYLNSILYILRFTSRFLHNLHHVTDESARFTCAQEGRELKDTKAKSSSLGRNAASTYGTNGSRSSSTKDLLSVGLNDAPRNKVIVLTEKLHEVFVTLHNMEHGSKRAAYDSYLPYPFLQALRDTNSIFCSDEQQDAHELLLYLFDNITDTCNYVEEQTAKFPPASYEHTNSTTANHTNSSSGSGNVKLWARLTNKTKKLATNSSGKDKEKEKDKDKVLAMCVNGPAEIATESDSETDDISSSSSQAGSCKPKKARNFLVDDFRGQTVRSTKCLQCENVTQRKEQFFEIAVPIRELTPLDRKRNPSELYREACLAPETLRGANKFYCSDCRHHNEAERSVAFERLPKIMILQQKRFMHTGEGFDKVNTYMPTPLRLDCFCEACVRRPAHEYKLAGVVMHVGTTMQSGHYKSYVAASERHGDYARCASGRARQAEKEKAERTMYFFAPMKSRERAPASAAVAACASRNCCSIKLNLNVELAGADSEVWLECNDEKVRPISVAELQSELAYKTENTNTPYLLFYEKEDRTIKY